MNRHRHLAALFIVLLIALAPVAYASAVTNYTYDANGNMVSDGRFYYVYDALNHMTEVREGGPTGALVERYWYDHAGRRVIKEEYTSNVTITTYYVNEFFEMEVYPDGSTVNTSYIYANNERVAKEVTSVNGTEVYYYHGDHLGSTSVVTKKGRLVANTISVNSNWTTVSLNESLVKPVVVAKLMTENDEENSVERINNVSSNSFRLRVEESPAYDGLHANETLGYIALEEGTITDGAADIGAAGVAEAGDVWTRVGFADKFDVIPVVVASPITAQDGGSGVARIRNIDIMGFDVRFEEYPSQDGGHKLEKIGWVALKPGAWTLDGKILIVGTASSVTANYSSVTFQQAFNTTPVVLAQTQSYNEGDLASHTRLANVTTTGFSVKIEEETDTPHAAETVGYVAVEPAILRSGAAKVEETKYYPYGVLQEGGDEKYLYTGKELDRETGLYYYGARYYNPSAGRFTQPDTIIPDTYNPQALNRYSYVLNNPLRYVDPSGKEYTTPYDKTLVYDNSGARSSIETRPPLPEQTARVYNKPEDYYENLKTSIEKIEGVIFIAKFFVYKSFGGVSATAEREAGRAGGGSLGSEISSLINGIKPDEKSDEILLYKYELYRALRNKDYETAEKILREGEIKGYPYLSWETYQNLNFNYHKNQDSKDPGKSGTGTQGSQKDSSSSDESTHDYNPGCSGEGGYYGC